VNSVFRGCRYQGRLRRWIAATASFVLALHVLLSPLTIGWQAGANDDVFVVCHGAGGNSDVDRDGPVKQPLQDAHCVLCTLTHNGCAVLPDASMIVALDAGELSQLIASRNSQVTEYRSPTGEYQRGPPAHAFIAG
jgi:hypothetical protein